MKIRAVIFDIYRTLLEVAPAPADAGARWDALWREMLATLPRMSLAEFDAQSEAVIAWENAASRAAWVPFPEVFWPDIASEVLPELAQLTPAARADFLFRHAQLLRTTRLMAGALETLKLLGSAGTPLGIASNAQPYTLRELDAALAEVGFSRAIFTPAICFHSFDHGFSKPDPHVFRILGTRLRAIGIAARETLVVGDRLDNDIEPAGAQGFQTWHLGIDGVGESSGDWAMLRRALEGKV